jgi:hypothetical protein
MNMKKTVVGTTLAAFMTVGLPTISHAKDLLHQNHAQKADEKKDDKKKKDDKGKKKDGEKSCGGEKGGEKSCGGEKK